MSLALTKKIAELAREKQLTKALEVFGQFELEGLEPSVYTFSSLINVHVRSGDLKGAKAALKAMRQRRLKPNVSIFTILLRGYSQAGNLRKARGLLDEMQREKVQPDARAMNTFLRGCLHHGQVALAKEVFNQMDSQWGVIPDYTSLRYMAQILGQALCIKDLKQLMQRRCQGRRSAPCGRRTCASSGLLAGAARRRQLHLLPRSQRHAGQ
ncbi:unnamed protein product [Effrenium voratum]|nr:unnamed protein product [Effrenium voratum]